MSETKNAGSRKLGYRIAGALALRGKKQLDLAKAIGVHANVISYFCSGKRTPNAHQLADIARELRVSADWLLGLSDAPTPPSGEEIAIEYTGLSEVALNNVKRICLQGAGADGDEVHTRTYAPLLLNGLLEHEDLVLTLNKMGGYIDMLNAANGRGMGVLDLQEAGTQRHHFFTVQELADVYLERASLTLFEMVRDVCLEYSRQQNERE